MNFKRFGRLNTKKLNEYKSFSSQPYDMSKIFPYSTTREINKENRYTLSSFNTLSKDYRFCYQLYSDCIAEIKRKGNKDYQECLEIKNNLYVFTNEESIDEYDCTLIYDIEYVYSIITDKLIIDNVFWDMKERKVSQRELYLIKEYLEKNKFLDNYIPGVSTVVVNEFLWRCRLIGTKIYKSNPKYKEQKYKKKKVEDTYSILNKFETNNLLPYEKLNLNQVWKFLNENSISLLFVESLIEIINKKFYIWSFLFNPYLKDYRRLFNKYRKRLSLWQTQMIFKKYKDEYKKLEDILEKLDFFYEVLQEEEFIGNVWDESLYETKKPFNDISNIEWKIHESKKDYENTILQSTKLKSPLINDYKRPLLKLYSNYEDNCGYLINKVIFSDFKELYKYWENGEEYIEWLLEHIYEGELLIYEKYQRHDPSPIDFKNWLKKYKSMSLKDYKNWVSSICPF